MDLITIATIIAALIAVVVIGVAVFAIVSDRKDVDNEGSVVIGGDGAQEYVDNEGSVDTGGDGAQECAPCVCPDASDTPEST
jgi:hypothetical protein